MSNVINKIIIDGQERFIPTSISGENGGLYNPRAARDLLVVFGIREKPTSVTNPTTPEEYTQLMKCLADATWNNFRGLFVSDYFWLPGVSRREVLGSSCERPDNVYSIGKAIIAGFNCVAPGSHNPLGWGWWNNGRNHPAFLSEFGAYINRVQNGHVEFSPSLLPTTSGSPGSINTAQSTSSNSGLCYKWDEYEATLYRATGYHMRDCISGLPPLWNTISWLIDDCVAAQSPFYKWLTNESEQRLTTNYEEQDPLYYSMYNGLRWACYNRLPSLTPLYHNPNYRGPEDHWSAYGLINTVQPWLRNPSSVQHWALVVCGLHHLAAADLVPGLATSWIARTGEYPKLPLLSHSSVYWPGKTNMWLWENPIDMTIQMPIEDRYVYVLYWLAIDYSGSGPVPSTTDSQLYRSQWVSPGGQIVPLAGDASVPMFFRLTFTTGFGVPHRESLMVGGTNYYAYQYL